MPKVLKISPQLDVITRGRDLQGLEILRGNFFWAARPILGKYSTMPLSNLLPTQIADTITPAQIPYFDAQEFATLSLLQLSAFTSVQLAAMTAEQTAAYELALSQAPIVEPTVEPVVEPAPTVEPDPVVLDPTEESNP